MPGRDAAVVGLSLACLVVCAVGAGAGAGGRAVAAFAGPLVGSAPAKLCAWPGAAATSGRGRPGAALRAAPRDGVQGAAAVMEGLKRGLDGINNIFNQQRNPDVEELKTALGDSEFEAVKSTIGRLLAQQREEMRNVKKDAEAQRKKLQQELNGYSNKVRELEFQLIMAATEVTDLEEKISYYQQDEDQTGKPMPRILNPEEHPVFGSLVADFGYKKVYSADPAKLHAATPIYKKQRTFRTERASAMARAKGNSGVVGWPGTITVVQLPTQPGDDSAGEGDLDMRNFVLVDGQHRLGAYTLLAQKMKAKSNGGPLPVGMGEILVEVYPQTSEEQAAEIFTEINKAEPCKIVDLPQSGATPLQKKVIEDAAVKLREKFSEMFRPSERCRTPHMNIDNLRDELFQSNVVTEQNFTTGDQLFEWMLERNAELGRIPDESWTPKSRTRAATLSKALMKARDYDFYLGLEWDWLDAGRK